MTFLLGWSVSLVAEGSRVRMLSVWRLIHRRTGHNLGGTRADRHSEKRDKGVLGLLELVSSVAVLHFILHGRPRYEPLKVWLNRVRALLVREILPGVELHRRFSDRCLYQARLGRRGLECHP